MNLNTRRHDISEAKNAIIVWLRLLIDSNHMIWLYIKTCMSRQEQNSKSYSILYTTLADNVNGLMAFVLSANQNARARVEVGYVC